MKRQKMVNLTVEETSGVDHPAHLHEGWIVMKSSDSGDVQAVLDALTNPRAEEESMPDNDTSTDAPEVLAETDNVVTVESLQEALAKANEEIEALRALVKSQEDTAADAEVEPSQDDILKAAPESVRKMIESLAAEKAEALAKAAEAEDALRKERDAAADAAAIEKVRGWSNLSIDADTVGPALRHLSDVDADLAKAVESTLDAANAQAESAAIFAEIGKSASPAGGDALSKMETLAKAAVEAGTASTYEQAFADVAITNPDLYAQHLSEKGA